MTLKCLLGDFMEEYREMVRERGRLYARIWAWRLALVSLPSCLAQSLGGAAGMMKNYFRTAWRNLRRQKFHSFINVFGLAAGITCTLLITVFVAHELRFDRHHEKSDRIYRIGNQFGRGIENRGAYSVPPLAAALLDDFQEIEQAVRISPWERHFLISAGDKQFLEKGLIFADRSFFDVFTIPVVSGNLQTALTNPDSVVLTRSASSKYFGTVDPLGKHLTLKELKKDFLITAVMEDPPAESHLQYDMIGSLNSLSSSRDPGWMGHCYMTYIVLKEGVSPAELEKKFPHFILKHYSPQFFAETGKSYAEYVKSGDYFYGYHLQPLTDIHLNAALYDNLPRKGNKSLLFIFSTIAAFVLLIACINFMNLSTLRFTHRSREVGMRKVLGAGRRQLIFQFLGESVLMSFFALGFSLIVVQVFLPVFSRLADRALSFSLLGDIRIPFLLFGFALALGLLSGLYPALFLSSFRPIQVVRGFRSGRGRGHIVLRRALVVVQLSITVAVLFGTVVIYGQTIHLRSRDLGFRADHVVVIHRSRELKNSHTAFRQALLT
ncbi:MAG: ABC transporter permease, partial [Candidatus Aminicenantes bacterium]|nr:ABC transporter permease [Candidatus Aminicenantes bacterium]